MNRFNFTHQLSDQHRPGTCLKLGIITEILYSALHIYIQAAKSIPLHIY